MNIKNYSEHVKLKNITLTDSFWKEKTELVRTEVIPYQYEALHDRVEGAEKSYAVENFIKAAKVVKDIKNGAEVPVYPADKWHYHDGNADKNAFDTDWKPNTDACIANIKAVHETYGKDVMICETGMPVVNPEIARDMLSYLLEKTKELDCCKGVFYWEPQAPNGYNDGYGLGAFKDGKPTAALDPFKE